MVRKRSIPGTLGHRGADKGLPPELGFGKCQSNDFDAQVADITITLMTYIVAALDLRFSEYETIFLARVLADYRRTNRSNCLTSVRHVLNVHG